MYLLSKYRLDKIGSSGLWCPIDKEEVLYNYIKYKYNSWIEIIYMISMKYNIYTNLLVHSYNVSNFLELVVKRREIPFFNPFMISIKNIPNYIKFNYDSSNIEIDILNHKFDYK